MPWLRLTPSLATPPWLTTFQAHWPPHSSWNSCFFLLLLSLPALLLHGWLLLILQIFAHTLLLQESLPELPSLHTVLPILAPLPHFLPGVRLIFVIIVTEQYCSSVYLSTYSLPVCVIHFMRMGSFSVLFTIIFPEPRRECLVHLKDKHLEDGRMKYFLHSCDGG